MLPHVAVKPFVLWYIGVFFYYEMDVFRSLNLRNFSGNTPTFKSSNAVAAKRILSVLFSHLFSVRPGPSLLRVERQATVSREGALDRIDDVASACGCTALLSYT